MTSAKTRPASDYPPGGDAFRHRHLIGIAQLAPWEISYVLDAAEEWVEMNRSGAAKHDKNFAQTFEGLKPIAQMDASLAAMLSQDEDIRQIGEKGEIGDHPGKASRFANFGGSEMSEVVECRCTDPNSF